MARTRVLPIRLSKIEHERLKNDAATRGYGTLSNYIRGSLLGHDMIFEKMFEEMYEKIVGKESNNSKKRGRDVSLKNFI
jgi:hypothetical protein